MKKVTALLFALLFMLSCSDSKKTDNNMVWICTGYSSHAYHSTYDCYGINSCRGEKKHISLDKAIEMGRTACHYCCNESDYKDPYDPDTYDPMNSESN